MGYTKPMENNQSNKMEFFNEAMILVIMYNTMILTDFVPDKDMQWDIGYIMIGSVLFHIVVNIGLLFYNSVDDWRNKWRRYRMHRKHAKNRAEQNRKIQKKKRHIRWVEKNPKGPQKVDVEKEILDYEMQELEDQQASMEISSVELSGQDL